MNEKVIKNVSKGFLKKLFGKDSIDSLTIIENGFTLNMEKGEAIALPFYNIKALKTDQYLKKTAPYRTINIETGDDQNYSMNISSDREEIDAVLKHYANYQLQGKSLDNINTLKVVLQYGLNDYHIRIENGNLIEYKNGEDQVYPLNTIEYYRVDKPSNIINIKFRDKKMFIRLSVVHVTNIWLVFQILERLAEKQNWLI